MTTPRTSTLVIDPTEKIGRGAPEHATAINRIPSLDGLRGVAIAAVILFHCNLFGGGFLGVDLFFVLSGYLITSILLREIRHTKSVSLKTFFGRRFRRLAPALMVVLAVVAVITAIWGTAAQLREVRSDGPWVQLNLANWHFIAEHAGYWAEMGNERVFGHLWSIAVEEQFYLVFPIALLALCRFLPRNFRDDERFDRVVATLATTGALASLLLMAVTFAKLDPSPVYTGTGTRAFSLLLGVLAATAVVSRWVKSLSTQVCGALVAACVVTISIIWWQADGTNSEWLYRGGLFMHAALCALLIVCCAQHATTPFARILCARPLPWLGGISYSLYLWHWPVIVLLTRERLPVPEWLYTPTVISLSLALAVASKIFVEDPLRFRAKWTRGRVGVGVTLLSGTLLMFLWFVLPTPPSATVDPDTVLNWTP